jgi:RimJ/RimL family protein N-acetyltransferase
MIQGNHVTLRPVASSDLPAMRRWMSNPAVMRYWGHVRPFVTEREFEMDLNGRFARFDDVGYFTIVDSEDEPIGRIHFEGLDSRCRSTEIGLLIGEESAQGKGYGHDAIIALMEHLYFDRNLNRIELNVFTTNERAIKAYERIGFVHEGTLRDHRYVDGHFEPSFQMSMLRREFEAKYRESSSDDA